MNAHVLGFPRMGRNRELKWALESYWRGESTQEDLAATAEAIKLQHWQLQATAGMDLLPVGDFSLYDHLLDMVAMLGAIPDRFAWDGQSIGCKEYFHMARGDADAGIPAMEMTKWFDSNYHYIVPELGPQTCFRKTHSRLLADVLRVKKLGHAPKPVLVGPVTFLALAKEVHGCNKWNHLEQLTATYCDIIAELAEHCPWVQIDEPILCTDLSQDAAAAFAHAYPKLKTAAGSSRLLLATYFGALADNLDLAAALPVDGLHLDLVRGPGQLAEVLEKLPAQTVLSLGLVDGRNIWKTDLDNALAVCEIAQQTGGRQIMLASSCSLLHSPMDLTAEQQLDPALKSWMAFAVQKCDEIAALKDALQGAQPALFAANREALRQRAASPLVIDPATRERVDNITFGMLKRTSPFPARSVAQKERLELPTLPTTTIGSYPQTAEIRAARRKYKNGELSHGSYVAAMQEQIAAVVRHQEELGLDVLVHGEPERNDMVEYFGQQLNGFCFTENGWVQSYGSRCVKPPIIYGDVSRPAAMTVEWITYAQSLTEKPMKGMLTGPVTILCWSFVRNDMARSQVCRQIALAIRDEVMDLEAAGTDIIQIDEAAFREGMPIRKKEQENYLRWAVDCFKLASCGVRDSTQIHSHMCYSEFNEIMEWITQMDADVISIEASRSNMELLDVFNAYHYPAQIGPGVYDIHSPRVPTVEEICGLLEKALQVIPRQQLWVNPDCGLKTRAWPETLASLKNMVTAARKMRQ